jgi:hypothetical protein
MHQFRTELSYSQKNKSKKYHDLTLCVDQLLEAGGLGMLVPDCLLRTYEMRALLVKKLSKTKPGSHPIR